jgi:hypothetical protein
MTEKGFKRKLTAIFSADVVGYSCLMGDDEEATVRTLTVYREVMTTLVQKQNGKVLDSPGDNLLAEFVSVVDAVQCAVAVQKEITARNEELSEKRRMHFRIGINLGDVIQEEDRIYGDGVNIAARLEGLAEPGGICISGIAYDQVKKKLNLKYQFVGKKNLKNTGCCSEQGDQGGGGAHGVSATGEAFHCCSAIYEHERRRRTGIHRRRNQRKHHQRIICGLRNVRHRPQLLVHLQEKARKSSTSTGRKSMTATWTTFLTYRMRSQRKLWYRSRWS